MTKIQMVDIHSQYLQIKREVDTAIQKVIDSCQFINGPAVRQFAMGLEDFLQVGKVQTCANGTDALQIAIMALDLQPGDEVIVPAFTYVATAEVIGLLGLKPVMVDVDYETFNTNADFVEPFLTNKTKAIVPVHLFGQNADMERILKLARDRGVYVVEDAAQSIGSQYKFDDGTQKSSGCMGHLGTTSFYPSKNLGCYGDGGAVYTNDPVLADKVAKIANHGQVRKYYHEMIGVNSRLDSIQAAILNQKLKHLKDYNIRRAKVAGYYDQHLDDLEELKTPRRSDKSTHVFHQYTLKIMNGRRDALQAHLADKQIPTMIYYPLPLYKQKAFAGMTEVRHLENTEKLCDEVISLPMHPDLTRDQQDFIIETVREFFT